MHLQRVQVSNYRVLQNIDIEFEKEFEPRIFPLGSQNGGGKSTLLQLIFIFLHCSRKSSRIEYLSNLLPAFRLSKNSLFETIIKFYVWDDELVELDFTASSVDLLTTKFDGSPEEIIAKRNSSTIVFFSSSIDSGSPTQEFVLACGSKNLSSTEIQAFLDRLSEKIFLIAPSTEIFQFLSFDLKHLLFTKTENRFSQYQQSLAAIKNALPSFATYDPFSIDILVDFFKLARSQDFEEKVKTGTYGNNYDKFVANINSLLNASSKKLEPQPDLSGVVFKGKQNGSTIELSSADLSHGELKRLIIYAWLKTKNIRDAIVLMDEIEIALHPDWQYQIVEDLEAWEPSNQYILATHSYELCQAVTPAHVKELNPPLSKPLTKLQNGTQPNTT